MTTLEHLRNPKQRRSGNMRRTMGMSALVLAMIGVAGPAVSPASAQDERN